MLVHWLDLDLRLLKKVALEAKLVVEIDRSLMTEMELSTRSKLAMVNYYDGAQLFTIILNYSFLLQNSIQLAYSRCFIHLNQPNSTQTSRFSRK